MDPQQLPFNLDYDVVAGRLLITARTGHVFIFYDVPLEQYIGLKFSPTPERFFRERILGCPQTD